MKRVGWFVAAMVAMCIVGAVRSQSQDELPDYLGAIVTDRIAYTVVPPEVVCGPRVASVTPSHSGSFALVERHVGGGRSRATRQEEMNLVLWDATTRTANVLWQETESQTAADGRKLAYAGCSVYWFHEQPVALVGIGFRTPNAGAPPDDKQAPPPPERYLLVRAGNRRVQPLTSIRQMGQILANNYRPVIAYQEQEENAVRILDGDGNVAKTLPVPASIFWTLWLPDGKTLFGFGPSKGRNDTGHAVRDCYFLDTESGAVTVKTDYRPQFSDEASSVTDAPPFDITRGKGQVHNPASDGTTKLSPLWLVSRGKDTSGEVLIAPDTSYANLSANGIYFQYNGTLFYAPIRRLPAPEYLAVARSKEKRRVISNAKQAALGLLMYAQDNGEQLPPVGDGLNDRILPYVKDDSILRGFSPLYTDLNLANWKTPATTPLGFITGPGGRAIIYGDGHVKWEEEKP